MTLRGEGRSSGSPRAGYEAAKRIFDVLVACIALLVLAPLLIVIAAAVRLDSAGPVFYRGVRTGRYGEEFRIFKFRTMVQDAEVRGGMSTAKNDPRVTRVGSLLRRAKLDELPQFLNVLRGEMSIVGPRPEVPAYTALYEGDERLILTVPPGITDFASIEFAHLDDVLGAEDADRVYETKVRPVKNALRVKYVKERSMLVDMKLIALTAYELVRSLVGRAIR